MHAYLAIVLALAAPALSAPEPRRLGYEREIDATSLNQVPKHVGYVLNDRYLSIQKNRDKLITREKPIDDLVVDDSVLLQSNVLVVRPTRRRDGELVRRRRGYNLENVRVPARYPYLPVPSYYRFRRWG